MKLGTPYLPRFAQDSNEKKQLLLSGYQDFSLSHYQTTGNSELSELFINEVFRVIECIDHPEAGSPRAGQAFDLPCQYSDHGK
jgi:hypothetical protein